MYIPLKLKVFFLLVLLIVILARMTTPVGAQDATAVPLLRECSTENGITVDTYRLGDTSYRFVADKDGSTIQDMTENADLEDFYQDYLVLRRQQGTVSLSWLDLQSLPGEFKTWTSAYWILNFALERSAGMLAAELRVTKDTFGIQVLDLANANPIWQLEAAYGQSLVGIFTLPKTNNSAVIYQTLDGYFVQEVSLTGAVGTAVKIANADQVPAGYLITPDGDPLVFFSYNPPVTQVNLSSMLRDSTGVTVLSEKPHVFIHDFTSCGRNQPPPASP